jgi:hypothetical protein
MESGVVSMKNLVKENLEIDASMSGNQVMLQWKGKSVERLPEFFLVPYFNEIIEEIKDSAKLVVLNFYPISYINSSTMNPIIILIKRLQELKIKCKVVYNKDLKWQKLAFSALRMLKTADNLFEIEEIHKDWTLS